jgi:hypothetical protein
MVVAVLYFQMIRETNRLFMLKAVFTYAFSKWSPKGEGNDLDIYVTSSMPVYWAAVGPQERKPNRPSSRTLERTTGFVIATSILVGVIAFEIQAYYELYQQHKSSLILWIFACAVSTFLLLAGYSLAQLDVRDRGSINEQGSGRKSSEPNTSQSDPDEAS